MWKPNCNHWLKWPLKTVKMGFGLGFHTSDFNHPKLYLPLAWPSKKIWNDWQISKTDCFESWKIVLRNNRVYFKKLRRPLLTSLPVSQWTVQCNNSIFVFSQLNLINTVGGDNISTTSWSCILPVNNNKSIWKFGTWERILGPTWRMERYSESPMFTSRATSRSLFCLRNGKFLPQCIEKVNTESVSLNMKAVPSPWK